MKKEEKQTKELLKNKQKMKQKKYNGKGMKE